MQYDPSQNAQEENANANDLFPTKLAMTI